MCPKSLNKQSSEYLWDAGFILGHIEEEHLAEDMTFYEASRQIYCSKNRQADVVKNMIKQIFRRIFSIKSHFIRNIVRGIYSESKTEHQCMQRCDMKPKKYLITALNYFLLLIAPICMKVTN